PRLGYAGVVEAVTLGQLEETVRGLQDLAAASTPIGEPREHPWRDASKTFYSEDDLATVRDLAGNLLGSVTDLIGNANRVQDNYHLPEILTFADIDATMKIASALKCSPGAPVAVLHDHSWDAVAGEARGFLEEGRELQSLKERVRNRFIPDVLALDHSQDI